MYERYLNEEKTPEQMWQYITKKAKEQSKAATEQLGEAKEKLLAAIDDYYEKAAGHADE